MKKALYLVGGTIIALIIIFLVSTSIGSAETPEAVINRISEQYSMYSDGPETDGTSFVAQSYSWTTEEFNALRDQFETETWELTTFQLGAHSTSGRYEYKKNGVTCIVELESQTPDPEDPLDDPIPYITTVTCN